MSASSNRWTEQGVLKKSTHYETYGGFVSSTLSENDHTARAELINQCDCVLPSDTGQKALETVRLLDTYKVGDL